MPLLCSHIPRSIVDWCPGSLRWLLALLPGEPDSPAVSPDDYYQWRSLYVHSWCGYIARY